MEPGRHHSEVAPILQQIETEYKSATIGLTGLAQCAKHAAITARMEHVELLHQDLQAIVGNDAIRLIAERLENIAN